MWDTPLWQSKTKLKWAHSIFNEAHSMFGAYVRDGLRVDEEYDEPSQTYRAVFRADKLPLELPMLIGSGVHSVRSALDTAVSSLVANARAANDARVNFPMHGTEANLRASFEPKPRTCPDCGEIRVGKADNDTIRRHLPDLERMILEEFKPWENGNYPLWALGKLDNIYKHRIVILTIGQFASGGFNISTAEGSRIRQNLHLIGPGEESLLGSSRSPLTVEGKGHITATLLFPQGVPFGGKSVFEVVKQLTQLASGIVETLEAHFKRG